MGRGVGGPVVRRASGPECQVACGPGAVAVAVTVVVAVALAEQRCPLERG